MEKNKNNIFLYKSGIQKDLRISGLEPYSEYYASQIAKTMELYIMWIMGFLNGKGKLCSTCLLFTNENISYIPVGRNYSKKEFLELLE